MDKNFEIKLRVLQVTTPELLVIGFGNIETDEFNSESLDDEITGISCTSKKV